MKKTFYISVQGTPEAAERAIKLLDRVFRWRYNVYGTYRKSSSYDAVVDVLTIEVLLTANWMDSPNMQYLFPEFQPKGIIKTWCRFMAHEHALDDLAISELVETERRA